MKENIIPATCVIIAFCMPYSVLAFAGPETMWQSFLLFMGSGSLATVLIRELIKIHNTIVKNNGDYEQ